MAKPILVNTTFMELEDMTLLCMTFWTLCRRSTAFDARRHDIAMHDLLNSMQKVNSLWC